MQSSRASFPDSPPRSGTILGVVKMAAGAVRLRIPTLSRLFSSAMPTTLSRLDVSELAPVVSSYSVQGFTIRGNKLIGSLALLPRGIFHWKVDWLLVVTCRLTATISFLPGGVSCRYHTRVLHLVLSR